MLCRALSIIKVVVPSASDDWYNYSKKARDLKCAMVDVCAVFCNLDKRELKCMYEFEHEEIYRSEPRFYTTEQSCPSSVMVIKEIKSLVRCRFSSLSDDYKHLVTTNDDKRVFFLLKCMSRQGLLLHEDIVPIVFDFYVRDSDSL